LSIHRFDLRHSIREEESNATRLDRTCMCPHGQMVVVAGIHHKGPLSADPGHKPAYSSPPMHACMEYKLNKTASHNSMLAKLLNQFNLQQHQIINLRCLVFNTPPPPPCVIYIVDFVVLARSLSVADGLFN
jgi:hypothetical protein